VLNVNLIQKLVVTAAFSASPLSSNAAIVISSVSASSTFANYQLANLTNGSGLFGGLHSGRYQDKWLSAEGQTQPTLTFDLGSVYALTNTSIWNYGGGCCGTDRNVKELDILLSTDGTNYNSLGMFSLSNPTTAFFGADIIGLAGNARYVRFDVLSNYGGLSFTGLSEVQFNGQAVSAVPETATWLMMIAGIGVVGSLARRRRQRSSLA
jgi:F5/8 type C domain